MAMTSVCKQQRPCFSTSIAILAFSSTGKCYRVCVPVLHDRQSLLLLSMPCLSLQNFLPCTSWQIDLALPLYKVKYRSVIIVIAYLCCTPLYFAIHFWQLRTKARILYFSKGELHGVIQENSRYIMYVTNLICDEINKENYLCPHS
jgi:hypothetical protein